MTRLFDIVREGTRQRSRSQQALQTGVIIDYDQGKFSVSAGGITYLAETGVGTGLKAGDRVWLVLGRGTPKIIGLLGRDEAAG